MGMNRVEGVGFAPSDQMQAAPGSKAYLPAEKLKSKDTFEKVALAAVGVTAVGGAALAAHKAGMLDGLVSKAKNLVKREKTPTAEQTPNTSAGGNNASQATGASSAPPRFSPEHLQLVQSIPPGLPERNLLVNAIETKDPEKVTTAIQACLKEDKISAGEKAAIEKVMQAFDIKPEALRPKIPQKHLPLVQSIPPEMSGRELIVNAIASDDPDRILLALQECLKHGQKSTTEREAIRKIMESFGIDLKALNGRAPKKPTAPSAAGDDATAVAS